MLGCIQPISSPMMKRMLGFCCCCCAATGALATTAAAATANRPSHNFRMNFMFKPPGHELFEDDPILEKCNLRAIGPKGTNSSFGCHNPVATNGTAARYSVPSFYVYAPWGNTAAPGLALSYVSEVGRFLHGDGVSSAA